MPSSPVRGLAALLAAAVLAHLAAGHYNLKSPMPYNRIDCNLPGCKGPCPPIWTSGKNAARNSPSQPSATWARGERVTIEWHRNNHEGGFYRRSLVPVKHMGDKAWHKKTAFEFGCWNQNRYQCGKTPACGTDMDGWAYRNAMTVPRVFPDGDYVFAMVWYGGTHWKTKLAFFSDYYTCAFVRIQGGPLAAAHAPGFVRGRNHRAAVAPGKCSSTSFFVGECGGEECAGRLARDDVPDEFQRGRRPRPVRLADLTGSAGRGQAAGAAASRESERRMEEEDRSEARQDQKMAEEERAAAQKRRQAQQLSQKKAIAAPRTKPGCGNKPDPPVGTWGPRKSLLWWRQRNKWWAHHNYCRRCGGC